MSAVMALAPPRLRRELVGSRLAIVRVVAVAYVALLLIAYARWIPRWLDLRISQARDTAALLADGGPYEALTWAAVVAALIGAGAWIACGAVIEWRRSRDPFGNLLFVGFVAVGVIVATDLNTILPMQRSDSWPQFQMPLLFVANALSLVWVFAFPDGRIIPRWAVLLIAIWTGWSLLRIATPAVDQAQLGTPAVVLHFTLVASPVASLTYRYFKRSDDVQRRQLKWALVGGLAFLLAYVPVISLPAIVPTLDDPGPAFAYASLSRIWLSLSLVVVALAFVIAILRYGLLDVDLVIRRTAVYALVAAILVAAFASLTTLAQDVLVNMTGQRSTIVTTIIALAVAAGFGPVRQRVRPFVDRLLPARELLVVLFLDIVGSTERIAEFGDERWRALLTSYRRAVRAELASFGGHEIDTAGDGFFATFEAPMRAARCAISIRKAVNQLGLGIRIGLHIGECDMRGEKIAGMTVHIGARVMSLAQPNEILATRGLCNLIDPDVPCRERGDHVLKGVPGTWRLYSVASTV